MDFGNCAASRRSQKKTCRRFSTRFESASRKLVMPREMPRVADPT